MKTFDSWGRISKVHSKALTPQWNDEFAIPSQAPVLAYGLGRSYGDSCLLQDGHMIDTSRVDRIIHFDKESGLLRADSGISLDAILRFCVPRGWFLPTTPGTRQVTLGGAIANDVHGKNHHRTGCFGNHVTKFELLRSDGDRVTCSPGDPLFAATIGGLGLTGIITSAEIQLVPIRSSFIDVEQIRFSGIDEFVELSRDSAEHWEHTVAWLDCIGSGRNLGRGIYIRGNWSAHGDLSAHKSGKLAVPIDLPNATLNKLSLKGFNTLYYRRFFGKHDNSHQHYSPFFHPLDSVTDWNRIYGSRGFFQYQCVIPEEAGSGPMKALLKRISKSGQGSFLAVLKTFGDKPSPGLLSFPMPGITLALDFPNRGSETLQLFSDLDDIVRSSQGRLYPAKDSRMSHEDFAATYDQLPQFREHVDPAFLSEFWKRMNP